MTKPAGASAYDPVPPVPGVTYQPMAPGVVIYRGTPLCPWDGSTMLCTAEGPSAYPWDGPAEWYEFECAICGWEDEVS